MTDKDSGGIDIAALMTSANLHRVNGDWDEALADASSALQINPNNPEITSLIGSIYEGRGNLSEALVWYRMAAEQAPGNSLYSARIQQIDKQLLMKSKIPASANASSSKSIWLLAIACGVLLLLLMFAVAKQKNRRMDYAPVASKQNAPRIENPQPRTGNTASEQDLAGSAVSSSKPRTKAEIDINSSASNSDAIRQSGFTVDDTIADPRTGQVIITCSSAGGPDMTRIKLLNTAYAIAQSSLKASSAVNTVTVRCVLFGGNNNVSTQILFVGDTSRSVIESIPDTPDETQIEAAFTQVWWNPQIK